MKKNLLDFLAEEQGVVISDLKKEPYYWRALTTLANTTYRYPLDEWNNALSYLCGYPADFLAIQDAQDFVLKILGEV